MISVSNSSFVIAIPEIYLVVVTFVVFVFGMFKKIEDYKSKVMFFNTLSYLSIFVVILTLFLVYFIGDTYVQSFNSLFIISPMIFYFKVLIIFFTILIMILSRRFLIDNNIIGYEYIVLVLFILAGNMLLISSNDFLAFYVSLEFVSICVYVLIFMNKSNITASEAGLKYFILGALGTGFLLYGISLIYGYTGKTNFFDVREALFINHNNWILLLGMVMVIVGMAFKLSLAPFHLWTLDVYKGSYTPIVLILTIILKIATLVIFLRIMWGPFYYLYDAWKYIIVALVAISAVIGFIGVIIQSKLKGFIAYSSIANMSYVLMATLSYNSMSVKSIFLYFCVYGISVIGFVGGLMLFKKDNQPLETINDLAGLFKLSPYLSFALVVFLFSMAGLPITAGFFAKIFVLYNVLNTSFVALGIVVLFLTVVMMFYYLKIIKIMYFDVNENNSVYMYAKRSNLDILITVYALCIFILLFIAFIPFMNIFLERLTVIL